MTIVLNSTTGITTPPVSVQGATSGSISIVAPDVAGTNTQTLVAATGTLAPLIAGTAVASTSGTSIDFTSIPSWVKRITVMFNGVSTSGTSPPQIQIGTSGGVQTTGYNGANSVIGAAAVVTASFTAGFGIGVNTTNWAAASAFGGAIVLTLLDSSTGIWACSGAVSLGTASSTFISSGYKSLSGTLDRVRITTVNGTDTFDAGSINILYE